ncbi:proteasome adapter and scaffold protein ECM29 isoform X2 [Nematostella vectensis]|uniref:proteasome adapter and scaffold protein ECM29 isoform X2 n=1 Tax=Nematostella vectensis TaxID=45351 RepID=UPI002076FEC8|nr:proteasome adapter and scaffold protein ECM29 isoform X2 [Nematostella vectensis]
MIPLVYCGRVELRRVRMIQRFLISIKMADVTTQQDLESLERVFFRLCGAQTDEALEKTIGTFLAPLLLKVSSQNADVKKKVMELLTHINKRLKSRPKVQLPVNDLLSQYQNTEVPAFVHNFTILYLRMGFPRLEVTKQVELAPLVVESIQQRPTPQQDCLVQLLLPIFGKIKTPDNIDRKEEMFEFRKKQDVAKVILDFVLDVLLLPYSSGQQAGSTTAKTTTPTTTATAANLVSDQADPFAAVPLSSRPQSAGSSEGMNSQDDDGGQSGPPPGLSTAAVKRVLGDATLEGDKLEEVKLGILQFLAQDVFMESEIICHFVIATGDSRHSIGDFAEHELKRISSSTDWEKAEVVNKMFTIFLGNAASTKQGLNPEHVRSPAGIRVKQRIFPYLLRSRRAASQFPACLQVVFDSLFGANPNSKLRVNAVQFVHHICLFGTDQVLKAIGAVILSGMTKLIDQEKENAKLRSLAYVAIGKLARRLPSLFAGNIALVQKLFDAICEESEDTRLAVQEALSMMAPAYKDSQGTIKTMIETLILKNVEKTTPQSRLVAVQFANKVFSVTHIPSRYVCMLVSADIKDDVREEARRGLHLGKDLRPFAKESSSVVQLPPFEDMVRFVSEKATERLNNASASYVVGHKKLAFSPEVFRQVAQYLRRCLSHSAGVTEEHEIKNEALVPISQYLLGLLDRYEQQAVSSTPLGLYLTLMEQALNPIGGADLHAVALRGCLEVIAAVPSRMAPVYHDKLGWIKTFTYSSKQEAREYAGRLLAIVVCSLGVEVFSSVRSEYTESLSSMNLDTQHGAVTALGFLLARHVYQQRVGREMSRVEMEVEDIELMETDDPPPSPQDLGRVVTQLVGLANSHAPPSLSCVVCDAVGEIGRNGPLPLPDGQESEGENKENASVDKLSVVNKLVDLLQNAKENKVQERAARAIGFIMVGDPKFTHRQKLIDGLCETAKVRQIELQFTVGEALSCVGAGSESEAARDPWTPRQNTCLPQVDHEVMQQLVSTIVKEYSKNSRPHARQASCVWLLSLVKYSGQHSAIKENLKHIQMTFMDMLAETDDLTQEVASKGLGLVYELGGEERREELVSLLVDTLTTGRSGGLSTYKELCSLASDLNQPDLIYKFMHLANHNALWNSRRGAAFGFSSIASHSREQLEPYLPNIIPKLYRYQYDPNGRTQQAMSSIWAALVPDAKATVDKYIKEILQDLVENLNSNLWRLRQSSCMALSDLLSGRSAEDVLDFLPQLWERSLRARDDIKETVRLAADSACRKLSKITIQICDVNRGKLGEKGISTVLPTLLHTGLTSGAEEVRSIALSTILKISKNAGSLLKPHIPVLVVALLESVSGLEQQSMNYISLHLSKNEDVQEKLESVRIASSKMSPMMETVNLCVQYVDEEVLPELIPRVADLLRRGVGLGTKVGCSGFVVSLCMQCPRELEPYAGKLLSSLLSGLSDRIASVRKSYATTIGHVVKVAKESSVEKLIDRIKNWYFEKEEAGFRLACGLTFQAITRYSPDVMRSHASKVLPTAYFAMHEDKKTGSNSNSQSAWEEIWLENTPGTDAGLRLYVGEITDICCTALTSQVWLIRAQAAQTVSSLAAKLGNSLKQPFLGKLLNSLVGGLAGRTWTGKDKLLESISCICTKCRSSVENSEKLEPSLDEVVNSVLKECRKENLEYKIASLNCFGKIVEEYGLDRFQDISELLFPIVDPKKKEDEEQEEGEVDEENENKTPDERLLVAFFDCLGLAWPKVSSPSHDPFAERLSRILAEALPASTWKVQLAVLRATKCFVKRYDWLTQVDAGADNTSPRLAFLHGVLGQLIQPVCEGLENKKYAAVRLGCMEVLETLISALKEANVQECVLLPKDMDLILNGLKYVYSDKDPRVRDKALALKKELHSGDERM